MSSPLELASAADAAAIAALRNAVADDLTARFGKSWWSGQCTERGVAWDIRSSSVFVARENGAILATLRLATKKPWAIDRTCFTAVSRPIYLTAMAVSPARQRQGFGRRCLDAAVDITRRWPADAIFLDAFDHDLAGAGEFYRKCGFREVARVTYRDVPLIYFENLLSPARAEP
jgi:GNAT superfamily N-acetyltransferase